MIYWNEKCKKWCFLQKDAVGIADVGQVEAVGGHGLTCGAAVVGVDGGAHLVDSHGTTADLEERADNGADHVTEEAVGGYFEAPFVVGKLNPTRRSDVTDIRLRVGVQLGETGEVLIIK